MNNICEFIQLNRARYLEELKLFMHFPSVSAQQRHHTDISACAVWLTNHLQSIGLDSRIIQTKGNPVVWAKSKGNAKKRIIIYGHYDVQPAEPMDKWISPPFEAEIRDGFIFGRGATDDKGQLFAHIKGIEALIKTRTKFDCEVLFLSEGEEECSGQSLADYIRQNKKELACDAVIISDGSMYKDIPAISYGLRGVVPLEIIVKGPTHDLHSGSFGGAVPNPATILAHIVSKCISADGKVLIPGFYDSVRKLQPWEKDNLQKLMFDKASFIEETCIKGIFGSEEIHPLEKMWSQPTFEINGIYGGYMGQGGKTIIPASAGAKITMRIVPDQDASQIADLAKKHIRAVCPDYVDIEITGPDHIAAPVAFDINHPVIKAAASALKTGFGKEPVYIREGGSIAVAETFWKELGAQVALMGFGNELDGAHSPNERLSVENFINAVKTSAELIRTV
jgi:acetylornithine deacetylase/succinyl-diaminopimelate desuccinylase-like protein